MSALKDLFKNPTAAELEFAESYAKLPYSGQRERNFEAFAQTGLPNKRVESWKYSDLRNAVPDFSVVAASEVPESPLVSVENALEIRLNATGVVLPKSSADGVTISRKADALAMMGAEDVPVAALGAALSANPHLIVVEISKPVMQPIHLVFENDGKLNFSRVIILVREGASAVVLESQLAGSGFSSGVLEYKLEPGATLERVVYQEAAGRAVQVFTAIAQLEQGAAFRQFSLGFGAKLCRHETRVFHQGEGTTATINGAYLLSSGQHYDQTSLVRHSAPDCKTRQVCKGAVLDGAEAVFQGKFYVARKAQKTDAAMAHNALILENGGSVDAKPELEIYADDVECAHGNTVGALDADALFYMRQRGLTETAARALLTEAFILAAFDGLEDGISEILSASARNWLEAQL